jgi:hypothetical protein
MMMMNDKDNREKKRKDLDRFVYSNRTVLNLLIPFPLTIVLVDVLIGFLIELEWERMRVRREGGWWWCRRRGGVWILVGWWWCVWRSFDRWWWMETSLRKLPRLGVV